MTKSAYIHIPFCRQKCRYCSFISFAAPNLIEDYLEALEKEINQFYKGELLDTLYLGGGTPSLLTAKQIKKILSPFKFDKNTEVTMELNPEHISEEYLSEIKKAGINRLSIGCQSFDKEILDIIGRKHTPDDVENAVHYAQNAGFKNINLDFIYGLPKQTLKSFTDDLIHAKNLGVSHISLYGLKIEEGCYFYKNPPTEIADDDLQSEMYLAAIKTLKDFDHYEISNFAKSGYFSRHNLNYWNNENYYGFGVAAHGYQENIRYSNQENLKNYILNPLKKNKTHTLSKQEQLEEEIFLGFRRKSGINFEKINKKFRINFEEKYSKILSKYYKSSHLEKTLSGCKLTIEGILVSNYILSDFIE